MLVDKYALVMWPESQELMEQPWFHRCVLMNDPQHLEDIGAAAYFAPLDKYEKFLSKKDKPKKDKKTVRTPKKKCYLCKETEDQVNELIAEGDRYVCDNCIVNR